MMDGKILRGIAGFYYVHVKDIGVFECKAKGVFRNNNIKPLVGDNVNLEILDKERCLEILWQYFQEKCSYTPCSCQCQSGSSYNCRIIS